MENAAGRGGLSVAMCTYNGAPFVRAQLESIARQTRPPDEVVVCDDGSADDTVARVRAFAAEAPFPVRLYAGGRNLGTAKNFERAIGLCTGAVIALADQDDVWLPEKLARTEAVFRARPGVGLVFGDADVVDEALAPLGFRLWETARVNRRLRARIRRGEAFRILCSRNFATGATMAFRAAYRQLVLPIPQGTCWIHDWWIAAVVAAVAELAFLEEPVMLYRQHAAQQIGAGHPEQMRLPLRRRVEVASTVGAGHYEDALRAAELLRQRLSAARGRWEVDRALGWVGERIDNLRVRSSLPASRLRRAGPVLGELLSLRYHRYANGVLSAAKDLLLDTAAPRT